jgi:hypothetical protein
MKYGILRDGAESLFVRAKPAGEIIGALRPGVKFHLTGETYTGQIQWLNGHYISPNGSYVEGWVAAKWLGIIEETPVPPDVEPLGILSAEPVTGQVILEPESDFALWVVGSILGFATAAAAAAAWFLFS